MRLARFTVSGEWLRVRSRKYMGAPGGVNVDRGTDSSPSSAANQSVGGGGDDIPDKLATPIRQPGRPPLRLRNRAETHSRCCQSGACLLPVCWRCRGGPPPMPPPVRCSLRGCRPSPLAATAAVSWCPVPCGGERPQHGSMGAFAGGGASCFFPHGQEDVAAPRGCAALGGARVGCPVGLVLAWLWWSTGLLFPALPLNSPSHRSRSSRPATPGTSSRSLPPERKSTLEAPADPLPPLPCRAGRRGRFPWRRTAGRQPWLPGRTRAPHRLCRLSPCAGCVSRCGPSAR
jgi:hypothetical protein